MFVVKRLLARYILSRFLFFLMPVASIPEPYSICFRYLFRYYSLPVYLNSFTLCQSRKRGWTFYPFSQRDCPGSQAHERHILKHSILVFSSSESSRIRRLLETPSYLLQTPSLPHDSFACADGGHTVYFSRPIVFSHLFYYSN